MKKLFTLILLLFFTVYGMAQGEQLSLKLEKGNVYNWGSQSSSTISQNIFGQSIDMIMDMWGSMQFRVEETDPEGYDLAVWYESLGLKMSGVTEMNIDSENIDPDDPFSVAFRGIIGKPLSVRMTRLGKILSVGGTEELMSGMIEELGSAFPSLSDQQKDQIKAVVMESYGEKAFKGGIESGLIVFPQEPVSIGESWTTHTRLNNGFPVDVETVYTLFEKNAEGYLIKGESVQATTDDAEPMNLNGMAAKYELQGVLTSETIVDADTGWIVSGTIVQDMSGVVKIQGNEQVPTGLSIPITMKTDMTITGIPIDR